MNENNIKNENYTETIRQMIKHEDEVRNQRTNWFLVIQGFLIAGICQLENNLSTLLQEVLENPENNTKEYLLGLL